VTPSAKREAIRIMTEEMGLKVTRACSTARLSRAAYYRAGIDRAERDRPVVEALNEIVARSCGGASGSATTACVTWGSRGTTSACIAFTAI